MAFLVSVRSAFSGPLRSSVKFYGVEQHFVHSGPSPIRISFCCFLHTCDVLTACKTPETSADPSNQKKSGTTPVGKLDKSDQYVHPDAEKEPLPPWPNGINPQTGERGGPKGPEPTRYGDWERKGRVSDF